MESQFRRRSMRASFNSDARRTPRRFFGRSASSSLRQSKSMTPEEESPRRRSFLAKPPAPGAARRVLAVLNQSQKRAAATNRKPPSTQPVPLAPTAYKTAHDKHPKISLLHNNPDSSSTTKSPTWSHPIPPSPLKKPIAPSRHVRPLDDLSHPLRTDSPASSIPYARPPPRPLLNQQALLEVDASEVSDEQHSTTDPKSRSGRFSASTNRSPDRNSPSRTQDLVFIDDVQPPGVKFITVGAEDADVPAAPTDAQNQFPNKLDLVQSWATYEERVRVLHRELEEAREGRSAAERANADLALRNNELGVLVNSLRTRTAESSAEVEELTRHLKDTRKRLTRRIRELEDELASQKSRYHSSDAAKYRERDDHARSEVSAMRPSLSRAGTAPSLPGRRRRVQALPPSMTFNNDVHTRPIADGFAQSPQNGHFAKIRSTGNVHDISARRKFRSESFSGMPRPGTPNRKPYSFGDEEENASPRTVARRSLIRRALIAHIHSSRYRTAKHAWYEFLHAEAGNVTPDQFARAVRGLAVAADSSDRDLDVLRQEVCGAEECDTGVLSWSMFLKFYQLTENERT